MWPFLSNRRTNDALKQNRLYEMLACDPDYIEAYGLQVIAGRGFSEEYGDDVDKLVINETAVRNLGFASNDAAIGELVTVECTDAPMQIIGVVKDYHQQALSKNCLLYTSARCLRIRSPLFRWRVAVRGYCPASDRSVVSQSFARASVCPAVDIYDVEEAAAEAVVSKIEEKFPDVDVELQFGGQPVYYYIVSVE